jgi:cobalt-zinc-cadmium efflux system outer membrane protein
MSLTARIEQNPKIARLLSEERIAKANQRLAEARRWPSLRPVVGVRHYAETDDVSVVAGLKVPLPLFNRNQGQIAATRAALARTRSDAEAARVRVHTAIFEVYQEMQRHQHRAAALRDEIVPRLAKAFEETHRGYEQGRYSYFEWRSVQADLLAARSALVEDSAGAHRRVISLERLTGEGVAQQ